MEIKDEIIQILELEINTRLINDSYMPTMGQRFQWSMILKPKVLGVIEGVDESRLEEIKDGLNQILTEFDADGYSESLDQLIDSI